LNHRFVIDFTTITISKSIFFFDLFRHRIPSSRNPLISLETIPLANTSINEPMKPPTSPFPSPQRPTLQDRSTFDRFSHTAFSGDRVLNVRISPYNLNRLSGLRKAVSADARPQTRGQKVAQKAETEAESIISDGRRLR
jgi:hypothetical protein